MWYDPEPDDLIMGDPPPVGTDTTVSAHTEACPADSEGLTRTDLVPRYYLEQQKHNPDKMNLGRAM